MKKGAPRVPKSGWFAEYLRLPASAPLLDRQQAAPTPPIKPGFAAGMEAATAGAFPELAFRRASDDRWAIIRIERTGDPVVWASPFGTRRTWSRWFFVLDVADAIDRLVRQGFRLAW